jgi:ribosomal protein S18 acetylase RimI-like enzyme
MPTIEIGTASTLDDRDLEAIRRLLPQLSRSATYDADRVRAMLDHPGVDLLVARAEGAVVGMATRAEERGLRTLDLTSRPSRTAAIALYESVGFVRRDSTVMRFAGRRE